MSDDSLFNAQEFEQPSDPAAPSPTSTSTHSLYRKYRPSSFDDDDLVGQSHVVNTLRNAIALNRISHAYLFCGPRGTGKTTTARLLAKAVNCLDPDPQARPCNACAACAAINANATIDVIEIDAASNRGIDDIRDLRERVKYAPTQLKSKFYIIDEAHQITGAAANAFLKTLEEPPAHTRFVLATTDPEELLQTIVSRCQRFDFRRIGMDATIARLRSVANSEGISIEDEALPIIARQATGSLRDALGMLDQVAIYRESATQSDTVTAETVRHVLGISRNERVESLARALADHDASAGLREISAALDAGDDIRQLGKQLVNYLRILLLQKASGTPEADQTAIELAARFDINDLAGLLRRFSEIDFKSRRSALPQLPLEIAMVEGATRGNAKAAIRDDRAPSDWESAPAANSGYRPEEDLGRPPEPSSVAPSSPRTSLRERVRDASSSPGARAEPAQTQSEPEPPAPRSGNAQPEPAVRTSAPFPSDTPPPSSAAGSGSGDVEQMVELWPKIRADVKAINRRVEALLQQVDPYSVTGNNVVLVSPYEFHRNRLNSDDVRRVVEDVMSRLAGQQLQVTCVSRDEAKLMTESRPRSESSAAAAPQSEPASTERASGKSHTVTDAAEVESTGTKDDPAQPPAPEIDAKGVQDRLTAARNIFDAEDIVD